MNYAERYLINLQADKALTEAIQTLVEIRDGNYTAGAMHDLARVALANLEEARLKALGKAK